MKTMTSLYIDAKLLERARKKAKRDEISFNKLIEIALEFALSKKD